MWEPLENCHFEVIRAGNFTSAFTCVNIIHYANLLT